MYENAVAPLVLTPFVPFRAGKGSHLSDERRAARVQRYRAARFPPQHRQAAARFPRHLGGDYKFWNVFHWSGAFNSKGDSNV